MLNHVIVRWSHYYKPKEIVKLGVEHLVFVSPLSTPRITILFQLLTVKFSNFSSRGKKNRVPRLIQVLRDKTFRKHGFVVGNVV